MGAAPRSTADGQRASARPPLPEDLGWVLNTIARRYVGIFTGQCPDMVGGFRGYQVLLAASGQVCGNQLRLAEDLGIDRTVMTYLIDDLEQADLVERRPDPMDRRAKTLVITSAGQKALERGVEAANHARQLVLAELPETKAEQLGSLLRDLVSAAPSECQNAQVEDEDLAATSIGAKSRR